jgi:hypothetical protein
MSFEPNVSNSRSVLQTEVSNAENRSSTLPSRLTRRQLRRRWFWLVAGTSFMTGVMLGCGRPQDSSVPVRIAPQSKAEKALAECAQRTLSAQFKTLEGEARPVCRRTPEGQLADRMLRPRYQAQHAEGRISIRQAVAFRQVVATGQAAINPEQQGEVVRFINNVCRPAITTVFRRSGVRVEFGFRMYRAEIDQIDTPVVAEAAAATERVRGTRVQSIIDFEVTESGLRLADEPEAVNSGSLAQTDFNVHQDFCAQLALRLSENLGFTSGRDCASRAAGDSPTARASNASAGKTAAVFKARNSQEFFAQAKLQPEDLEELYRPVCQGSIAISPNPASSPSPTPNSPETAPSPEPTPVAADELELDPTVGSSPRPSLGSSPVPPRAPSPSPVVRSSPQASPTPPAPQMSLDAE